MPIFAILKVTKRVHKFIVAFSGKDADSSQGVTCGNSFRTPWLLSVSGTQMGEHMSINITAKNDYSFLFRNLGSSGGAAANLNFLSDYASIKNGSYGKLMKAYYAQSEDTDSKVSSLVNKNSNSTSSDTVKTLANVQNTTDALKESADALLKTGKNSVWSEEKITDAVYNAISTFVDDYNSVVAAADDVNSTSILSRTSSLTGSTTANANLLEKVGITVGSDNTLKLDKEAFMKADFSTVKGLFNGNGSYAYRTSAQSSLINFAADNEAVKANTYNFNGNYSNNYTSGSIFNSFF